MRQLALRMLRHMPPDVSDVLTSFLVTMRQLALRMLRHTEDRCILGKIANLGSAFSRDV